MSYSKIKKIRLGKWDRKWSLEVRNRDGECQAPGCYLFNIAAHHIKGRSCKATRFMLDNGISLCPSHHVFSSQWSAHKTPEKFERWFKKEFPDRHKAIIKKAQTIMSERLAIAEFETLLN